MARRVSPLSLLIFALNIAIAILSLMLWPHRQSPQERAFRSAIYWLAVLSAIATLVNAYWNAKAFARLEKGRYRPLRAADRKRLVAALKTNPPSRIEIYGDGGDDISELAEALRGALEEAGWAVGPLQHAIWRPESDVTVLYETSALREAEALVAALQQGRIAAALNVEPVARPPEYPMAICIRRK